MPRAKPINRNVAEKVFIPAAVINQFPQMAGQELAKEIIRMLRECGVDFEEIRNWTRADHRAGYWIYYIGSPVTELAQLKLTTWQR